MIWYLVSENGQEIFEVGDIKWIVEGFFIDLLKDETPYQEWPLIGAFLQLANDEIDAIQVPPVDFEVKATVHSMGPLKAPPFILSRSLGGGEWVSL